MKDMKDSRVIFIALNLELLSFYDKDMKWVIEPGDFIIMVGTSSNKTQSIKLNVIK
jgi:beta-glucosidase